MQDWLVAQRRRMSRLDYGVVLLIVAVITVYGLLSGVGFGLIAALGLFAVEYSRVRVVRQVLRGSVRHSRVTRAERERLLLDTEGERIIIFDLQGYIFFGTATTMLDAVRTELGAHPAAGPRYLILNFANVSGLDAAGLYAFSRLQQQSDDWDVTVLLSAMAEPVRRQFDAAGLVSATGRLRYAVSLDRALEWCEDALVRGAGLERAAHTLGEQLRDVLPEQAQVERLLSYLERHEAAAGERLMGRGDPADALLFIESGKVTAQIERPGTHPLRLQTMVDGTVVGEIGFYLGAPRTADVVCDESCVVYRLSAARLAQMRNECPDLAAAIHEHLARRMAERLTHTIRSLDAVLDE